ncbi:MAG: CBS domain-containing protein [Pontiellaceae bacterium]|nr:CBS domain-containing protein [Pontiellaceae bacterium]
MKTNLENTTVKNISYLIHSASLRAPANTPLEKLADMLCAADRYKVYLEDETGILVGTVQARQIAKKILEFSRRKEDTEAMLPAIAFALNAQTGQELAVPAVTVEADTCLKTVIELMNERHSREIAVVDADGRLIGTLDAKTILAYYLQSKAESNL